MSCRLYLITPPAIDDLAAFGRALAGALDAGDVAALQIRLKGAADEVIAATVDVVTPICHARDVAVILNDRADLAARFGCDGVHLGQSDGTVADARRLLGKERMVGVTCHDSRHLAMEAAEAGADYVAFGAFYPTTTKDVPYRPEPDILTIWQETMEIPCVAIGGINAGNAGVLAKAGADFVAVVSAVWGADDPAAAVRALDAAIKG
jgi:thiamine-phosphate pyrophosphorylase